MLINKEAKKSSEEKERSSHSDKYNAIVNQHIIPVGGYIVLLYPCKKKGCKKHKAVTGSTMAELTIY